MTCALPHFDSYGPGKKAQAPIISCRLRRGAYEPSIAGAHPPNARRSGHSSVRSSHTQQLIAPSPQNWLQGLQWRGAPGRRRRAWRVARSPSSPTTCSSTSSAACPTRCSLSSAVFFNATLHLAAFEDLVVAVDVEGNNWRLIDNPFHRSITVPPHYDDPRIDIFLSQGQLYFAACTAGSDGELSVWALEDYNSAKWTLKHNVKCSQLLGINYRAYEYNFISFHPERNTIFIVCGDKNTLISYEMDCRESCFIYEFGSDHQLGLYGNGMSRYFQYVPLFTASLEDGN